MRAISPSETDKVYGGLGFDEQQLTRIWGTFLHSPAGVAVRTPQGIGMVLTAWNSGYLTGQWLNTTFGLSDSIANWLFSLTHGGPSDAGTSTGGLFGGGTGSGDFGGPSGDGGNMTEFDDGTRDVY